jgi:hypothetical protein
VPHYLAVTVPRYRLETITNERSSTTTTTTTTSVAVGLLVAAGVASMLVGLYPMGHCPSSPTGE